MMTKKDYELIALAIKATLEATSPEEGGAYTEIAQEVLEGLTSRLGYSLLCDNPKFNQSKFENACGVAKPF